MAEPLLLDTSPIIAHLRGRINIVQLISPQSWAFTSYVTVGELLKGVHKAEDPMKERTKVDAFLALVSVVMPDKETTEIYGRIAADLEVQGQRIPANDTWIAAMALQAGMTLATGDDHFKRVPNLKLVQWTW
ncbi:MAG: type II toxin-antitoxin system VapC family toxin [Boseongicola sp.]|nr:type II toxin-antitoxin system VapC family toxin [Boseongicola sp.]